MTLEGARQSGRLSIKNPLVVNFKCGGGETMLVDAFKDQWVCSCGNWVDGAFEWCPECCEEKFSAKPLRYPGQLGGLKQVFRQD